MPQDHRVVKDAVK